MLFAVSLKPFVATKLVTYIKKIYQMKSNAAISHFLEPHFRFWSTD